MISLVVILPAHCHGLMQCVRYHSVRELMWENKPLFFHTTTIMIVSYVAVHHNFRTKQKISLKSFLKLEILCTAPSCWYVGICIFPFWEDMNCSPRNKMEKKKIISTVVCLKSSIFHCKI